MFVLTLLLVGDGTLRIWNSSVPQKASMTMRVHDAEVLSCSWCKYDANILATGGSDGLIRGWDLRSLAYPIFEQKVRKCMYSIYMYTFFKEINKLLY